MQCLTDALPRPVNTVTHFIFIQTYFGMKWTMNKWKQKPISQSSMSDSRINRTLRGWRCRLHNRSPSSSFDYHSMMGHVFPRLFFVFCFHFGLRWRLGWGGGSTGIPEPHRQRWRPQWASRFSLARREPEKPNVDGLRGNRSLPFSANGTGGMGWRNRIRLLSFPRCFHADTFDECKNSWYELLNRLSKRLSQEISA